jgi:hypothetical protein
MKIDTRALVPKLEELILDAAKDLDPGDVKLRKVVREAADWLASKTKLPIPDAIEAAIYAQILWIPVQIVFDRLRDAGKV